MGNFLAIAQLFPFFSNFFCVGGICISQISIPYFLSSYSNTTTFNFSLNFFQYFQFSHFPFSSEQYSCCCCFLFFFFSFDGAFGSEITYRSSVWWADQVRPVSDRTGLWIIISHRKKKKSCLKIGVEPDWDSLGWVQERSGLAYLLIRYEMMGMWNVCMGYVNYDLSLSLSLCINYYFEEAYYYLFF